MELPLPLALPVVDHILVMIMVAGGGSEGFIIRASPARGFTTIPRDFRSRFSAVKRKRESPS